MKLGLLWIPLALTLNGCAGGGEEDGSINSGKGLRAGFASTWAEFLAPKQIAENLPLLSLHSVAVNVAWPAQDIASPDRLELAAKGQAEGVEVWPWLLLDQNEGYWPGSTNATRFAEVAVELMDAWDARGLRPTTLIVDMELRKDRADELSVLLKSDVVGAIGFLKTGLDPAEYASATATYRELVKTAHARGFRVHLTTLPQVIDDYADGDDGLRQAFGIPIEGIEWDTLSFQAYRTLFGDLLGGNPTSYFVYAYGVDARARFGGRAGLDVGLVGQGVTESSVYPSGADLASDLEACRAAGVPRERVHVYNLDGILERAPSEQWLVEDSVDPIPPAEDQATLSIRTKVALLDKVL